jgi:hypothetical protein
VSICRVGDILDNSSINFLKDTRPLATPGTMTHARNDTSSSYRELVSRADIGQTHFATVTGRWGEYR